MALLPDRADRIRIRLKGTCAYASVYMYSDLLHAFGCRGGADLAVSPPVSPRAPGEDRLFCRERSPYVARVSLRARARARARAPRTYLSNGSAWRARRPTIASAVLHRLQYGSQTGSRRSALALLVTALSPIHNRRKSRWLATRRAASFRRLSAPIIRKLSPADLPRALSSAKGTGPITLEFRGTDVAGCTRASARETNARARASGGSGGRRRGVPR